MEENKSGAFTTSIGNLPPGKEVLITIVYVQELQFKDSLLQFTLPTTDFAPNGQGETAKFTRSKSNEYEKAVPYGVRVSLVKIDSHYIADPVSLLTLATPLLTLCIRLTPKSKLVHAWYQLHHPVTTQH